VEVAGFEPCFSVAEVPCKTNTYELVRAALTANLTHDFGPEDLELKRIINRWNSLPKHLRIAVLSIVDPE